MSYTAKPESPPSVTSPSAPASSSVPSSAPPFSFPSTYSSSSSPSLYPPSSSFPLSSAPMQDIHSMVQPMLHQQFVVKTGNAYIDQTLSDPRYFQNLLLISQRPFQLFSFLRYLQSADLRLHDVGSI